MPACLVVATRNQKKKKELLEIIQDLDLELKTLDDYPGLPEVVEDGATFEENAIKKAAETARLTGEYALADDSGLEVDALGGRPGVYSARFAGEPCDDRRNNEKLLSLLEKVPEEGRTARFRCVIAIASPGGEIEVSGGVCEGRISFIEKGNGGFGYDPLFLPAGYEKTFAELPSATKHSISHRGKALREAKKTLDRLFGVRG